MVVKITAGTNASCIKSVTICESTPFKFEKSVKRIESKPVAPYVLKYHFVAENRIEAISRNNEQRILAEILEPVLACFLLRHFNNLVVLELFKVFN